MDKLIHPESGSGSLAATIPGSDKFDLLGERLEQRQAVVGVIGLGYVGLPLCVYVAEAGFKVVGYDVDSQKISMLAAGKSYVKDLEDRRISGLISSRNLEASTDSMIMENADVMVICVPTPLTRNQVPDLGPLHEAASLLSLYVKPGTLVILESTTYPGCTREELLPALEKNGMKAGNEFWLAFSPERINPGDRKHNLADTPKLVGGITKRCTEIAARFYEQFIDRVVCLSSAETAEMAKLLENVYRSVNIALVNELAIICSKMGISIWEAIDAAATKPFGFTPFYPGPGMGGHCVPVDPFYLAWKARELGLATEFVELAGKINTRMPLHVTRKIAKALNQRSICMRGASVLILGASYKADVADLREAPAVRIAELLIEDGATVSYHDPYIDEFSVAGRTLKSVPLDSENLANADCVAVITAHSTIDWDVVAEESKLVVDTHNVVPHRGGKVVSI